MTSVPSIRVAFAGVASAASAATVAINRRIFSALVSRFGWFQMELHSKNIPLGPSEW
jgi:hypothetical protein